MSAPPDPYAARLRRWTLGGLAVGALAIAVVGMLLLRSLGARAVLDVRRTPLNLHGGGPLGSGGGGVAWRQGIAALAGPVDRARLRVAVLSDVPASDPGDGSPLLRARTHGADGWSPWVPARDALYRVEQGAEGHLEARFEPPLPAGVPLELELAAGRTAPGAGGTLSPFLRYRGPVRHLTAPPDRPWVGRSFERACQASSDGLVPLTALVLAVGDLDLGPGPVHVSVRAADGQVPLAEGVSLSGARARGGHLLVPLDRPLALRRVAPLVVRIELAGEGALLGDDGGPSLIGLFGAPGPRPELGALVLVGAGLEAPFAHHDLALRLDGPPSLRRAVGALEWGDVLRLALAAAGLIAGAGLAGRALGAAVVAAVVAGGAAAGATRRLAQPAHPFDAPPSRLARLAGSWPGAALVLALALGLRVVALDSGATSPDDGEYLRSAGVAEMHPGLDLGRALREDRAWVMGLAEDFGRQDERLTYQHGYLHQLCVRWAWRIGGTVGVGRVTALRADQALLGALTALLAFVWLRRAVPREPWVALAGGALVATQLVHAHVSRTGWSQAGATFFLVLTMALAWRMRGVAEHDRRRLRRAALGVAASTTAAYGFHEMSSVYVVALALIMLLEFGHGDDGRRRWPWRSARTLHGLAACVPVGALTLGLLLGSEYARTTWFQGDLTGLGWRETRSLALRYLAQAELPAQLGWAVLALAPLGLVAAFLRDSRWARWLTLWTVVPTGILFLRFNYPHLVRIYLPAGVLLCLFAAEGLGALGALLRGRWGRAVVVATGVGSVALGAATIRGTLLAPGSAPLHVAGLHQAGGALAEPRRPLTPLLEALGPPPGDAADPVGVRTDRLDPYFRLLDAGRAAVLFDPRWPLERWPRRVIAPAKLMDLEGRVTQSGGPYQLVALDRRGTLALYARVE